MLSRFLKNIRAAGRIKTDAAVLRTAVVPGSHRTASVPGSHRAAVGADSIRAAVGAFSIRTAVGASSIRTAVGASSIRTAVVAVTIIAGVQSCAVSKYAANTSYPAIKDTYQPSGSLEEVFFNSSEPGMAKRRAYVYLPEGYHGSTERYPVLYLLHGARGNECVWIDKGGLLRNIDSLNHSGAMLPTIVVLPNVNQYNDTSDYGNSRLKSALESFYEVDGTVETHFLNDVVASTDSLLRTIPDKEHRAVAGLSIGAMQSIYLSANFPDTFGYVGMFSPMVHSFIKPGPDNRFYHKLKEKQAVQFKEPPYLYQIMIGRADFFHPSTQRWAKSLDKRGYANDYTCVEGGHEWYNWTAFCNEFMKRLWK